MMKTKLIIATGLLLTICSYGYSFKEFDAGKMTGNNTETKDSSQYQLIVFDPGFSTYLLLQRPMEFYSENYYKNWNLQYVTEWNERYATHASSGLYENLIDYDPHIEYGEELEYQLYNYFRFFEKKNHITLIPRAI